MGFSLLEMLMVLLLLSILIALLMQALSFIHKINGRTQQHIQVRQTNYLQISWLNGIFAGLYPLSTREVATFQGDSTHLKGLSTQSLRGIVGETTAFNLILDNQQRLWYHESENETPIQIWQTPNGHIRWFFQYQNADGEWVSTWPTGDIANTRQPLPQRICLCNDAKNLPYIWSVTGKRYPNIEMNEHDL